MKRPIYVAIDSIKAIKLHVQNNPNYLAHIYSDHRGDVMTMNRRSELEQAKAIINEIDSARGIVITTSDQVPSGKFPVIVVNEQITNDVGRIGSGQGIPHFIDADSNESKLVHNISSGSVSISIFSDNRNEVDVLGHVFYCGLIGMASHLGFQQLMNAKISKQPFRRLFEGGEDIDGIHAVSITIDFDMEIVVPVIDKTYPDFDVFDVVGLLRD